MLMKLSYMRVPIGDTMKQTIWVTKLNLLEQLKNNNMNYFTVRFFSEGTILETLTTNKPYDGISNKILKEWMKSYGATEAQLYESTKWGHYETGRTNGRPIKTIKK